MFLNIFYLYAKLPSSLNKKLTKRGTALNIKKKSRDLNSSLNIALACIFQGFNGEKFKNIANLPILDAETWGYILDLIMTSIKTTLPFKDKINLFRLTKILSAVLEDNVFNQRVVSERLAELQKDLSNS